MKFNLGTNYNYHWQVCQVYLHYLDTYIKRSCYDVVCFSASNFNKCNFLFIGSVINICLLALNWDTPLYSNVMEAISRITGNNCAAHQLWIVELLGLNETRNYFQKDISSWSKEIALMWMLCIWLIPGIIFRNIGYMKNRWVKFNCAFVGNGKFVLEF